MGNVNMEASQINYRGGSKKMSVEEAIKAAGTEITPEEKEWIDTIPELASQEIIAPEFDADEGVYAVGDLVIYQGGLYQFTTAHETAGAWNAEEVAAVKVSDELDSLKSGLTDVNSQFTISSESQEYTGTSTGGNTYTYKIRNICKNIYLVLIGVVPNSSTGVGNTDTIALSELPRNIVFGVSQNNCTISSAQRDPSLITIPSIGTKNINLWGAMTEARSFEILAMLVL